MDDEKACAAFTLLATTSWNRRHQPCRTSETLEVPAGGNGIRSLKHHFVCDSAKLLPLFLFTGHRLVQI
jgi:hypothetical protein